LTNRVPFKSGLGGHSRSVNMLPLHRSYKSSYQSTIVSMLYLAPLSRYLSDVEEYRDVET